MVDVGDENDVNRHQHLKVVANTFRLQHPRGAPVTNIDVVDGTGDGPLIVHLNLRLHFVACFANLKWFSLIHFLSGE